MISRPSGSRRLSPNISLARRLEGKPASLTMSPVATVPSSTPHRASRLTAPASIHQSAARPSSSTVRTFSLTCGLRHRMRVTSPSTSTISSMLKVTAMEWWAEANAAGKLARANAVTVKSPKSDCFVCLFLFIALPITGDPARFGHRARGRDKVIISVVASGSSRALSEVVGQFVPTGAGLIREIDLGIL